MISLSSVVQNEIVRRVEALFALTDQIEPRLTAAEQGAVARAAFNGKLEVAPQLHKAL